MNPGAKWASHPEMDMHATLNGIHLVPAYLDGGTGSMMLQAAIAGLLSVAFVAKTRWNQLKAVVLSKRKSDASPR